jgi:dihydroflavonol-4-reductase
MEAHCSGAQVTLKALVTGGTGFVGSRVLKMLLDDGWKVRALVLPSERRRLPDHPDLEPVIGDVTKSDTLRGTMDDVDGVFHLAALVESWVRDPDLFLRVNVGGTDHMIDEALRAQVGRFVFTSSLSGIGVTPGALLNEESPKGKVFGEYEASKAEAERHVAKAVREHGLPAVTLIPGVVLGPGDQRNAGKFLLSFVNGEFPGTFAEESMLPLVDVDDVARAHLLAYEKGRVGERYIVSGENRRWGDLIRVASEISGTPVPSRHLGGRALWLASRSGEVWARVTRSPPRLPAWLADFLLTGAMMNNTKSIRELGMSYRPIDETIRNTIEWFREEGLFEGPEISVRPRPATPLSIENPPARIETELETAVPDPKETGALKERRPKRPEGPG